MSEAPARKAPVTNDPASAPPQPQQRQGEHDQRQDVRQDPRQEQRHEQQPIPSQHQQQGQERQERPAGRLEDEWQAVQYEFVDDPKAAVRKADDLVTRAIEELTARHRSLSKQLAGNGDPQTEDLRLALHRYRELFKTLVAAK